MACVCAATQLVPPCTVQHVRAAGVRSGVRGCSPHVLSLHERIRIDGASVSEQALQDAVQELYGALEAARRREAGALSHFEVLTALSLHHFRQENVCPFRLHSRPHLLRGVRRLWCVTAVMRDGYSALCGPVSILRPSNI